RNGNDCVRTETVGVIGIVAETSKCRRFRIETIQAISISPQPNKTVSIFEDRRNLVKTQGIRRIETVFERSEFLQMRTHTEYAVVPGGKPERSFPVVNNLRNSGRWKAKFIIG